MVKRSLFSVGPNVGPKSVLLLDLWTGHCPNVIARNRPENAEDIVFLTIPAGTTGQQQTTVKCLWFPSGIFPFYFKNAIINRHFQFSSPKFRNLIKYTWFKSGYVENRPEMFETFVDYCFKKQSKPRCDVCDSIVIITCLWFKKSLCFQHFFHDHHLCYQFEVIY
ncbi:hypothetical protein P5V15_004326 [Pogonomyrmex californicus]